MISGYFIYSNLDVTFKVQGVKLGLIYDFYFSKSFGKNTLLVNAGIKVYTRSTVTFK